MKRLGPRRSRPSQRHRLDLTFRGKQGEAVRKRTRSWVRSMVEPDIRLPPSKSRPFTSVGKKAGRRLDAGAERALQAGPVPLPLVPAFMFEGREALFSGDPTATSRPQTRELRSTSASASASASIFSASVFSAAAAASTARQDGGGPSSPLSPLYGSIMSPPRGEQGGGFDVAVTPSSPVSRRGGRS